MKITHRHSQFFFFTLLVTSLFLLIYILLIYSSKVSALQEVERPQNSNIVKEDIPSSAGTQKEFLNAKAYIVYDIVNKKVISGKNFKTPLPIASMTKIITVGTLLKKSKDNNIPVRDETKLRIKKALIQSSNEEADNLGYVYSFSYGSDLLEDSKSLVSSLDTNDVTLTSLTGLDNYDGSASNAASAESMAKIFAYMYENFKDVFEYTKFDELEAGYETITNTNHTSANTFGILASKTGYTFAAGGNLGVIVSPEPGSMYAVVVMGSTKEGRFVDMQKILSKLPNMVK